jgi:hypothetical protein
LKQISLYNKFNSFPITNIWQVYTHPTCASVFYFHIWCRFRKAGTVINFWIYSFAQKKISYFGLCLDILYTQFLWKKYFCNFYRFLKKWCFEPKKVDEKSSNGQKFPLTELNCKYLSILEKSCYVDFEKNVTKKVLGQKWTGWPVVLFFSSMFKFKNKYECHFWFFFKFCRKTLWYVENPWLTFWRWQIFCFREIIL